MTDGGSLISLGNLTEPATVLVTKICNAVGIIYEPTRIKRKAGAEAKAGLIQAESQIQVTDLHRRAMYRFLEEEAKKQSNIEDIMKKAIPLLDDKSAPQNVSDDWITNFFDKSRIVSDDDMQGLWSRVLAGEANTPGAFAKRTVNLLGDLDKEDAVLFKQLCGFGWVIGNVVPLIFDTENKIYNDHGITFNSLSHLESLGLIQFNPISDFIRRRLQKTATVFYYGQPATLSFPKDTDNDLELGQVLLTRAGQQLALVCKPEPVDGFFQYVRDKWIAKSLIPNSDIQPIITPPDVPQ